MLPKTFVIGNFSAPDHRSFVTSAAHPRHVRPFRHARGTVMLKFLLLGSGVVITITDALFFASSVKAHGPDGWKYPLSCCHGDSNTGDCQMIPYQAVTETPDGFRVVLNPGDHRLVSTQQSFRIPYGQAIPSGDRNYHICLHPTQSTAFCFFAPPGEV
jgi:hypothetical protein